MDTSQIIAPLIHPNGDRAETLENALMQAYSAVNAAMDAVRKTAPNERNFYPLPGLFEQARAQHDARIQTLQALKVSLFAECKAIDAQW